MKQLLIWVFSYSYVTKPNFPGSIRQACCLCVQRLQEKRVVAGRSSEILELSSEELLEEKLAVQKALLTLENTFGRPVDPRDRDLVRPLYQRYRALKRLVIRSSAVRRPLCVLF